MEMIPTREKKKLPSGFSYPAGAERISSAMHGVPQFGRLQLDFDWRDEFWASRYAAKIKSNGTIEVLVAEKSILWPEWMLRIRAVPSAQASVARAYLDAALPSLRTALLNAGIEAESFRYAILYDLAQAKVVI